ncbi:hypothetical protein LMG26684_04607 [Achromobacter mucicolens]|uniref:glycoside hydrolase family 75 protein n=1 Tax=Achromobacter mucicolens TaxID=1389922 RepID=UPI001467DFF2|nr:glycoside hydrolase family 75 protein [Achromobacter mucicolens]CAB3901086.1 hypothetical protein LMG26684_04607 [Achromobacter mucicolens]
MTQILETIKGIQVVQDDDGRVHWTSGAAIDADGANGQSGGPFAYRADNRGLDNNANAGYPNGNWTSILIDNGNGKPLDDGSGNWYSQTTYFWAERPVPTRYVDSTQIPYVVVNPKVRIKAAGVVIGCKARVTYKDRSVMAVVADVSGSNDIGELSIAAARALELPESPRAGGISAGVQFELWPGTEVTIDGETYKLQPA